jgi:peroxiredoxin
LRRWEELRPQLDARGIQIVAISTDTPEQIRKGRAKHGARAILLSDPQLEVTDRYNLRNERNVTPRGWTAMPIPTTFLVDASGSVRWIDQARDYQQRSDPDRVLDAIERALGPA